MEYALVLLLILGGLVLIGSILFGGQQALKMNSRLALNGGITYMQLDDTIVSPMPALQTAHLDSGILFLTGADSQSVWTYPFAVTEATLKLTMNMTMVNATFDQIFIQLGGDQGLHIAMTHNVSKGHYNFLVYAPNASPVDDGLRNGSFAMDDYPDLALSITMVPMRVKNVDTGIRVPIYRCKVSNGKQFVYWNVPSATWIGELLVHAAVKGGYVRLDRVLLAEM